MLTIYGSATKNKEGEMNLEKILYPSKISPKAQGRREVYC